MMHFLAMGGYAAFVWPAYGITFAGLGAALAVTLRAYAHAKSTFEKLEADEAT
jgi:heme exporter protein CcmD